MLVVQAAQDERRLPLEYARPIAIESVGERTEINSRDLSSQLFHPKPPTAPVALMLLHLHQSFAYHTHKVTFCQYNYRTAPGGVTSPA